MRYPETLSADLKYLASRYQWNPEDKNEGAGRFHRLARNGAFLHGVGRSTSGWL